MRPRFVLSDYIDQALAAASYEELADGTFAGRIPPCPGVVAFAETSSRCEEELRSVLEDWILVGLKIGQPLPILAGIDLNRSPTSERPAMV
jgi:predicted RNase H-like HicB family nuclease